MFCGGIYDRMEINIIIIIIRSYLFDIKMGKYTWPIKRGGSLLRKESTLKMLKRVERRRNGTRVKSKNKSKQKRKKKKKSKSPKELKRRRK